MPRRSILSATERESLLTLPDAKDELIRLYTFNDADLARILAASGRGKSAWFRGATLLHALSGHRARS
jgi:hypothetical protein